MEKLELDGLTIQEDMITSVHGRITAISIINNFRAYVSENTAWTSVLDEIKKFDEIWRRYFDGWWIVWNDLITRWHTSTDGGTKKNTCVDSNIGNDALRVIIRFKLANPSTAFVVLLRQLGLLDFYRRECDTWMFHVATHMAVAIYYLESYELDNYDIDYSLALGEIGVALSLVSDNKDTTTYEEISRVASETLVTAKQVTSILCNFTTRHDGNKG